MKLNFWILFLFILPLAACSVEISLESIHPAMEAVADESSQSPHIHSQGEKVAANGFTLTGAFAEVSEKQVLTNGYAVEGAFYE